MSANLTRFAARLMFSFTGQASMQNLITMKRTAEAAGFQKMIAWIEQHIDCAIEEGLFAFEHTGLYSLPLSLFLHEKQYKYFQAWN